MSRFPRAFWFIWTALLLSKAGGFVVVVQTLYLTRDRQLSESTAGLVVAMFGLGGAAGVLVSGVAADRLGRKVTMVSSALLSAVALAALAELSDVYLIGLGTAVFGFANAALGPSAIAAIADVVPAADRDRAFNLMFWAMNLGMGAATLLAGYLAQWSYLLLYRLDAATGVLIALLVLVGVPESLPGKASRPSGAPVPVAAKGRFGDVWRDRVYLVFVLLALGQAIVYAQTQTTLPLAMTGDGLSTGDYGTALAIGSAMIILGQLFVPRLIARFRSATVLTVALLFMAAGFGAVGLVGDFPGYLACVALWTIGAMLAAPPNATAIAELSPAGMRGRYQGVFALTFSAAAFAAPAVGGFTLQHLGGWHWGIIGGLAALVAAGHLAAGPARRRAAADRVTITAAHTTTAA